MQKFDAAQIVDLIERHRVTTFTATPTMLKRISDLFGIDDRDLSSIEWILQERRRCRRASSVDRVDRRRTDPDGLRYDRGTRNHRPARRRVARTPRQRRPPMRTRSRSWDRRRPLPAGEVGDIYAGARMGGRPTWVSSPDVTAEDWRRSATWPRRRRVRTRRPARRHDHTGGSNVFLTEVEAALIDHPAVADVVIGLRTERGQRATPSSRSRPASRRRPPTT
jgi:bile acid-coenzyme A ligase